MDAERIGTLGQTPGIRSKCGQDVLFLELSASLLQRHTTFDQFVNQRTQSPAERLASLTQGHHPVQYEAADAITGASLTGPSSRKGTPAGSQGSSPSTRRKAIRG